MIPGEIFPADGDITLNADREAVALTWPTPATGRSRSARTTISPRPTPRSTSTAPPPAAAASTSPPAPPCASSPARPARCGSIPYAGARRVFGFNAKVMGGLE